MGWFQAAWLVGGLWIPAPVFTGVTFFRGNDGGRGRESGEKRLAAYQPAPRRRE